MVPGLGPGTKPRARLSREGKRPPFHVPPRIPPRSCFGREPGSSPAGTRAAGLSHGPVNGDWGSDVRAGPAHPDTWPRPSPRKRGSRRPVLRAAPHFSSGGVDTRGLPSVQILLCGSLGRAGGAGGPPERTAPQFLKSQRGGAQLPKGGGGRRSAQMEVGGQEGSRDPDGSHGAVALVPAPPRTGQEASTPPRNQKTSHHPRARVSTRAVGPTATPKPGDGGSESGAQTCRLEPRPSQWGSGWTMSVGEGEKALRAPVWGSRSQGLSPQEPLGKM